MGGVEKYLAGLLTELGRRGNDLAFAYEHDAASAEARVDTAMPGLPLWDILGAKQDQLLSEIEHWHPDCVFFHGCRAREFEGAITQKYLSYLFAHDHQRTCPTGSRSFASPSLAPCTRKAGWQCLVCHYPRRCGGLNPIVALRGYTQWKDSWSGMQRFRRVFVASGAMREEMLLQGLSPSKIGVIAPFNGEVTADADPPKPRPFTNRIVFLGRLVAVKGAELLIRALPLISERLNRRIELIVAGDGSERQRLEGLARNTSLPVTFPGWLDAGKRTELLRGADLLAVPSRWPEPYGMVGAEAGAVGVPAVAFATGGVLDWLKPGISGELAAAQNGCPESFAAAAVRALADMDHHQQLREGAWRHSQTNSVANHVNQLEQVWREQMDNSVAD